MKRLTVNRDHPPEPEVLELLKGVLSRGGLVVFPTETLYGLSADPRNPLALERLFHVKRRSGSRLLPFVAADLEQARRVARIEGPMAESLAGRFWPGPLTLVVPLRHPHPLASREWGPTIAIRVPGASLIRGLAGGFCVPLPATSVNFSGEAAASNPSDISPALLESIDLLLDAGPLPPSLPSTVLSLIGARPKILRSGAVTESDLAPLLKTGGAGEEANGG